jgi:hypothetical protein
MVRLRRVRSVLATLILGLLVGFVVPTFAVGLQDRLPVAPSSSETATARRFMIAVLQNDQATLQEMSISPVAPLDAARLGILDASVTSLSHLGSTVAGGVRVHSYAVGYTLSDGRVVLLGFQVASIGRFAGLVEPPEPK